MEEYYATGDLAEAAAELEDMAEPELQHFLVKRAVATALDKHNREREMTCLLLSSLYSEVRASKLQSRCNESAGRMRLWAAMQWLALACGTNVSHSVGSVES